MKNSRAPSSLSKPAQRWWKKIAAEYAITDDAGQLLLTTALEAFDRMKSAAERIEADGEVVMDRFNQAKAHPLLSVERDARAQMLAALRALNLDVEPLRDHPGRPPGR